MLSHYRLVEKIGEGGMGVVWKAHDSKLHRTVALKLLKPENVGDEKHRQRFLREARSIAAVTHPYIASIYDAGEANGTLFIVMEFVEGKTLRALLRDGPISIREAETYAIEIAEGLAKAHQSQVIHRDLKPENVIISADGHAKILDFGLAKIIERRDEATTLSLSATGVPDATTQGTVLGTPAYMSPEQARGGNVDTRSDIFSFGSTVYEMLTGRASFRGPTHQDSLASVLRDQPAPASHVKNDVPSDLERIVSRCLRKTPEERYNDTRDLVAALRDAQRHPEPQIVPTGAPPKGRTRHVVIATAIIMLIALFVWLRPLQRFVGSEPTRGVDERANRVTGDPDAAPRRNWIVVADFEAPADDPGLALGAREFVTAALERSGTVSPISGPDLKQGLRLAMKPDTTRVTVDVARELALRSRGKAYVEGRIDRMMEGYSIVLRARDPKQNQLLASVNGVAVNKQAFIATLDSLVRQVRVELGEVLSAMDQRPLAKGPMTDVMTSSVEACVKLHQGRELLWEGHGEASIRKLHEALRLDPDFALAWFLLGVNYWNRGDTDSALVALDEALRRPEHLTESQSLMIQADYAGMEADYATSLALFEQLLRQDPGYITAYNDRGATLAALGRYEEALEIYRRGQEMSPFGPIPMTVHNEFLTLMRLGRVDEARQAATRTEGVQRRRTVLVLAMVDADWNRAERLATQLSDDPSLPGQVRSIAKTVLASVAAVRGEVKAASRALEQTPLWETVLLVASQQPHRVADIPTCADTTTFCFVRNGVQFAAAGDTAEARRYLDRVSRKPITERRRHDMDIAYLKAWIAMASGRWEDAAKLMEAATPHGRIPIAIDYGLDGGWLVANAYEKLGRLEEAAQHFERLLLPQAGAHVSKGLCYSFAHQRLTLLYSKMGRVEDAREHWEIFEKAFTNPDPELVPMIDAARQAVTGAQAKS